MDTLTHTHIHTHIHMRMCTHTFSHAYVHTYTHTHIHMYMCTPTRAHLHTHTHTCTHTHTEWMTDDLLNKISSHPLLSKVFQEPRLAEVLSQFQSNPQAALAAASGNPEMQQFLQEFCSLMGDHFTALADKEEKETKPSAEQPLIAETTATGE